MWEDCESHCDKNATTQCCYSACAPTLGRQNLHRRNRGQIPSIGSETVLDETFLKHSRTKNLTLPYTRKQTADMTRNNLIPEFVFHWRCVGKQLDSTLVYSRVPPRRQLTMATKRILQDNVEYPDSPLSQLIVQGLANPNFLKTIQYLFGRSNLDLATSELESFDGSSRRLRRNDRTHNPIPAAAYLVSDKSGLCRSRQSCSCFYSIQRRPSFVVVHADTDKRVFVNGNNPNDLNDIQGT